jgi:hypothetical protein
MILHSNLQKNCINIEYQALSIKYPVSSITYQNKEMSNEKLNRVIELIQTEKSNEARIIFNEITPEETVEYLMVSGKLEQKFQNWGKAMNAYSGIIQIDPENTEAKNRIKMIQSILNFWNPEMFNP